MTNGVRRQRYRRDKRATLDDNGRKPGSRTARRVGASRRWIGLIAGIVALLLGSIWCYLGPVLRVRSIVVLGGNVAQRTRASDRLSAIFLDHHVWSISKSEVVFALATDEQLRGEVKLRALDVRPLSPVVVEISQVPLLARLQDGYALTQDGALTLSAAVTHKAGISVCPIPVSSSSLSCQWHPQVGEQLPARLVDVLRAVELMHQRGQPVSVDEVRSIGVVLGLTGSRECILGSANQPRAQVQACLGFSTPGAVLDVINPNSPAVLLNDRVG